MLLYNNDENFLPYILRALTFDFSAKFEHENETKYYLNLLSLLLEVLQ